MREVKRVLRDDGVLFINLGDSYASNGGPEPQQTKWAVNGASNTQNGGMSRRASDGLPPKSRLGIPHRVVFALQDDGWIWRDEIVWAKGNTMPESVTDRTTKAHEFVFLLSKRPTYYYDAQAIAEPATQPAGVARLTGQHKADAGGFNTNGHGNSTLGTNNGASTRNRRSVWTINSQPFSGAHFATMPPKLAELCILAGSSAKGCCPKCGAPWERIVERQTNWQERRANGAWAGNVGVSDDYQNGVHGKGMSHDLGSVAIVDRGWRPTCSCDDAGDPVPCIALDPFSGSGTTGRVAVAHGRRYIGTELNLDYIGLHDQRMTVQTVMEFA